MDSVLRTQARTGQHALFLAATTALPLAGWTVHAIALHRRLAAAKRDPLTSLLRREAYTTQARRILRRPGDAAVVMVDADRFKQINDRLGHAAGDMVLAAFGVRLTAWAGRRAAVGRLGGDEFFSELTRASRDQVTGRSVLREPVRAGERLRTARVLVSFPC